MQSVTRLILLAAFLGNVYAACDNGCLRCLNTTCVACDFNMNFFLSNGTCQYSTIQNCATVSMNGGCLQCTANYILDSTSGNCIIIPAVNLVSNCITYNAVYQCTACSNKFYLSNNVCSPVPVVITNCLAYTNNGTLCSACAVGYNPSVDSFSCVLQSGFPSNCLSARPYECTKCSQGALPVPNKYLDILSSPTASFSNFYLAMMNANTLSSSYLNSLQTNFCQLSNPSNCAILLNLNTCAACMPGFYFNQLSNSCVQNPQPSIPFCISYLNGMQCRTCQSGYYLSSPTNCTTVNPITNCQIYDGSALIPSCLQCIQSYYLVNNACVIRVASLNMTNCATFSNTTDVCLTCAAGLTLTSDSIKCLPSISNCLIYSPSTSSTTSLTCTQCINLYYLGSTGVCVQGTITNCLTYSSTANTCAACVNGFYLYSGTCLTHPTVLNCLTYHGTSIGVCTACSSGFILFSQVQACKAVTPIANCATYSSSATCSSCINSYRLSSNACVAIDSTLNCLQMNSNNICTLCSSGYALSSGLCSPYNSYQTSNCATNTNTGTESTYNCNNCTAGSIPLNYNGLYACVLPTENGVTPIANCLKHKYSGTTLICMMCASTYYISSSGQSCLATCTGTVTMLSYNSATVFRATTISDAKTNICDTLMNNCAIYVPHNTEPGVFVCAQCASNTVPWKWRNRGGGLYQPNQSAVNYSPNLSYEIRYIDCLSYTSPVSFFPSSSIPDPSCDSYYKKSNYLLCQSCIFGRTGAVSSQSPYINGVLAPYLTCTTSVNYCNTNIRYGGLTISTALTAYVNYDPTILVSCHSCSTGIPFVFFDSTHSDLVSKPFGLTNDYNAPYQSSVLTANVVQCLVPSASALAMPSDTFTVSFVANCGMAAMDTSVPKTYKENSRSIYCLACSPGYRRVFNDDRADFGIMKCIKIDNCASSNMFNYCSQCESGYTLFYDPVTKGPSMEYCVPLKGDANCLVVSEVNLKLTAEYASSASSYCFACAKGYSFNTDGICEQKTQSKCNGFSSTLTSFKVYQQITNDFPLSFSYYIYNNGEGCNQCLAGYSSFQVTSTQYVCEASIYTSVYQFYYQSPMILYCQNYYISNSKYVCLQCSSGYILSSDKLQCLSSVLFPNCLVFYNGKCVQCNDYYILSQGTCFAGTIANCVTYDAQGICQVCKTGFILSQNVCLVGSIMGCISYNSNGNCNGCDAQYVLVSLKNSVPYCLSNPANLNCRSYDPLIQSNSLKCLTCSGGFALTANIADFNANACLPVNPINNCLNYDIQSTISLSTLTCTQCPVSTYYNTNGLCSIRTQIISNCLLYNSQLDLCLQCQSGYYLSANSLTCISNPNGILGCQNYTSATVCSQCLPNYFLAASTCTQITSPITNCLYYASSSSCSNCMTNYLLISPTNCTKALALNCLNYTNISTCASCATGYGLLTDAATLTVNCVPITIPFCANFTTVSPFSCITCITNYYAVNGNCLPVTTTIPGCIVYSSANVCSVCASNLILSVNGFYCIDPSSLGLNLTSNCNSFVMSNTPSCAICQTGYFLTNSSLCAQCQVSKGCFACDPNNSTTCLICSTGYYMNNAGGCIARQNTNPPDPIIPDSEQLIMSLVTLVILLNW